MKTIVCYGDSNTWGFMPKIERPEIECDNRYPYGVRWTSLLQTALGHDYRVEANGRNGRTTAFDDPFCPGRNGLKELDAYMQTKMPVDLVTVMLGTNDSKEFFNMSATSIALGARSIIDQLLTGGYGPGGKAPEVLLICPVRIGKTALTGWINDEFTEWSLKVDEGLSAALEKMARSEGVHFFDLGAHVPVDDADGIHMNAEGHKKAAELIEKEIRKIIG